MAKNKLTEIIAEDWLSAFPQLYKFNRNKFFKIIGCAIIGIELVNIPVIKGYKPHLVIYPLWRDTLKACLEKPSLYLCINDKKGFEFSIPYSEHHRYINEVVECVKTQVSLSFEGDVSFGEMHNCIDQQSEDLLIKNHSAKQASLYELKFCYALYAGNEKVAKNILEVIGSESKNWKLQLFKVIHGDFNRWFMELQEMFNNKNHLITRVRKNIEQNELKALHFKSL